MSLTLISNPVITESGIVKNIFAGFQSVEFVFKREDLQIVSVGQGSNNKVQVYINQNLTSYLSLGDSVYLGANDVTGVSYDDSGEILDIDFNSVTLNIDYIGGADNGYINYLKNYYVDVQLIDVNNPLVNKLPLSIIDDGDQAGNINIDISIANDKNKQQFQFQNGELLNKNIKFKVKYKQVYEGSSENYTTLSDEIILCYCTDEVEIESFLSELDEQEFYEGYPFGVVLCHSDQNNDDLGLEVVYDELDLNKSNISLNNSLYIFNASKFGFIFINFDTSIISLNANTEYVKFKANFGGLPQYEPTQYNNSQYNVTI